MPINAPLLRLIAEAIELHPDNYDQQIWSSDADPLVPNRNRLRGVGHQADVDVSKLPYYKSPFECTSRCCIAGFALALTPVADRPEGMSIPEAAAELLGLSVEARLDLFDEDFRPIGMSVAQALRKIADTGEMLKLREYSTTTPDDDDDERGYDSDIDG